MNLVFGTFAKLRLATAAPKFDIESEISGSEVLVININIAFEFKIFK